MDRDVEKASATQSDNDEQSTVFAPINSNTNNGRRPSTSATLSRTRSQNGYSCDVDGGEDDDDQQQIETPPEKDPFEVGWDDGDNDPLCPRSFNTGRRWLIVVIVSMASFCV